MIFGERALNYEEGKWRMENGTPVFSADAHTLRVSGECMEGFIQQTERQDWKYGDFLSGSAVRMDAAHIFDRVKSTVSRGTLSNHISGYSDNHHSATSHRRSPGHGSQCISTGVCLHRR